MRLRNIISAGITVIAAFSLSSCESIVSTPEHVLVTLRNSQVSYENGQMFVSVVATGDWTLKIEYEGGEEAWASLSKSEGTGSANNVILAYSQNDGEAARKLTVVLTSGTSGSEDSLTQLGKPEEGNEEDPEYPGLVSDSPRQWLELPAYTVETGCAWVFHNMTIDGKTVRNYSMYYDAQNMLAHWVAYPLNPGLIGSGNRTEAWEVKDPKIPLEYQPFTERGWGVSGYDRGHQIPSADRYTANVSTFYPTNMTVQDSKLNQNTWGSLEAAVRTWAEKSDTLYVVTGCVPGENEDDFITDRGGNRVNKPAAYYKALMRYSSSSGISPYLGIAFYFTNTPFTGAYSTGALTIDELEQKLGMDFFPNVPDEYEVAAESSISAWWGIN